MPAENDLSLRQGRSAFRASRNIVSHVAVQSFFVFSKNQENGFTFVTLTEH
jgi:hypothetical protein